MIVQKLTFGYYDLCSTGCFGSVVGKCASCNKEGTVDFAGIDKHGGVGMPSLSQSSRPPLFQIVYITVISFEVVSCHNHVRLQRRSVY